MSDLGSKGPNADTINSFLASIRASPACDPAFLKQRQQEEERRAADALMLRRNELMVKAGIPLRRRATAPPGAHDHDAVCIRAMKSALARPDVCITVLAGGNGVGKTVAAAVWMLHQILALDALGKTVKDSWVSAYDLCNLSAFDRDDELSRLRRSPCLVVQELGAEVPTATQAARWCATLFDLLDFRADRCLQTCFTTNLETLGALQARYGVRITERFKEGALFFEIRGANLRDKKKAR